MITVILQITPFPDPTAVQQNTRSALIDENYGIYYSAGIEGSALLTPVMGYLIDRFGFYSSFTIAAIAVGTVTLICSVFLWGKQD